MYENDQMELIDLGDCVVVRDTYYCVAVDCWVDGGLVIAVVLHWWWSAGVAEQRVKAPGDAVGLHATELFVDDWHQRGGAQDQQHQHLERQGRPHHPSEESVAASQHRLISANTVEKPRDPWRIIIIIQLYLYYIVFVTVGLNNVFATVVY